jgi:hypothetical protein
MHAAVEAIRTLTGSDAGEAMKIIAAVVESLGSSTSGAVAGSRWTA